MGVRSGQPLHIPYFAFEASVAIQHTYSDKCGPRANPRLLGITLLRNFPAWIDPMITFCSTNQSTLCASWYD